MCILSWEMANHLYVLLAIVLNIANEKNCHSCVTKLSNLLFMMMMMMLDALINIYIYIYIYISSYSEDDKAAGLSFQWGLYMLHVTHSHCRCIVIYLHHQQAPAAANVLAEASSLPSELIN